MPRKKSIEEKKDKLKFHPKDLSNVCPLTENQKKMFMLYNSNMNLFLHGSAGTGKSFLSMFLALRDILEDGNDYERLIIIRSSVPTRDMGFLPGSEEEKMEVYEEPYMAICDELFDYSNTYRNLKRIGKITFFSTSFIRGNTFNNSIILLDEVNNCNFHEIDSVITRVGKHSKIIFSGDTTQTDLLKSNKDQCGIPEFMSIIKKMKSFGIVDFGLKDIVRGEIVKEYLTIKEQINPKK